MDKIVECVPNFSEGIDKTKIKEIEAAILSVDGVKVLDVDSGIDTNRTVITFVGSPESVKEAAFLAIKKASEIIDMRKHSGAHPRIGATDVCPFIPVSGVSMDECVELARQLGKRVGSELDIPVYFYEFAATRPERKNLATIRAGEYEGLEKKLKDPAWIPDEGPCRFNPKSGATIIGAREFLIAYNVNLNTRDVKLANKIAFAIREKGRVKRDENGKIVRDENGKPIYIPGRLKCVKAIGWYIDEYGCAQVSINLTSYKTTPLHLVYETCREEAEKLGLLVTGSELVGLTPLEPIIEAGKFYLRKQGKTTGIPERDIIETAIQSLGLNSVARFDPEKKIIDYRINEKKSNSLAELTVCELADEVSRNSPAPGGGSISALAGAFGVSLCSMVASLTSDKKGFESVKPEMIKIGESSQKLKYSLIELIDKDTEAFNHIMSAWRLPKKTDAQKEIRANKIEEATKLASQIPLDTMKMCYNTLKLLYQTAIKGNPSSISDTGVGAYMAYAGLEGAAMNVLINLKEIKDQDFINRMKSDVYELRKNGKNLISQIQEILDKELQES